MDGAETNHPLATGQPFVLMDCRPGCGACCIAPSISSLDKPAGVACRHLAPDYRCTLFGAPGRPACCSGLQPSPEMCGNDRTAALAWLTALEAATSPPFTTPSGTTPSSTGRGS